MYEGKQAHADNPEYDLKLGIKTMKQDRFKADNILDAINRAPVVKPKGLTNDDRTFLK